MTSVAIIGTGIAGLGCAHFLQDRVELTLFEQAEHIGGHTNTVTVDEQGRGVPIDTGFMVFNEVTYPNLTRLFRDLDVETRPTAMSFSVQHVPGGLEYNGSSVNQLFGQRRNLVSPRHWRMLMAINRFNVEAVPALDQPQWDEYTLAEYVTERGYGSDLLDRYLLPMSGSVWSAAPERMLEFPAKTLLRFWHNHGFLGLHTQHPWRTVSGGAQAYVSRLTAPFRDRIRQRARVVRVIRGEGWAEVVTAEGSARRFDKVVFACHADEALALLADPTERESRLLGAFAFQRNTALLHTDARIMPRVRRCWASWNYRIDPLPDGGDLPTIHYWMNSLQGVSEREQYFVSLNSEPLIAPERVLRRIEYSHPLFDLAAVKAQRELPRLNRLTPHQETYYAGAWFKYGFHEDGFTSGLECARALAREDFWE
ncbi:MAG: FAD-dependent oxidoreductase [Gemmatimonadota bacterium]